jgi:murein DD-endopeptidase MepM/ murein hydrolase activator NlpD
MHTVKVRVPVVLAILLALSVAGSANATSPLDKLKKAQSRLEQVRDQLERVSDVCERDERRVARINTRVEDTLIAVSAAEVAVDEQRQVVAEARERMEELQARADTVDEISSGRVIELYKRGVPDPTLNSLLQASSTEQALSRAQVLNVVKTGDRKTMERLLSSKTAADGQRRVLQEQENSYSDALAQRETLLGELKDVREEYERKIAKCNEKVVKLQQQESIAEKDEQELSAALAAQGVINVPPGVSSGGWAWPARGTVTSGFGYRWGRLHAGVDIAAPIGTPIYAAKGGVVSYAGVMGGYGNIIVVDHGDGMTTRYAHQNQLAASVGQTVRPGQQIGYVGNTGNSTGPHLHFEVRINDSPNDPMGYLP